MTNPFTEKRIRHFERMSYEQLASLGCDDFLVSELEYLISETPLKDEDKRICVCFYIKKMTNEKTAEYLGFSVDKANDRRKILHEKMILTLIKMFFAYDD